MTAWNGFGKVGAAHLTKGCKVMVVGSRLSASARTDRSGKLRTTLELTADRVKFLDAPTEEGEEPTQV
ncbi:MAG: single-stranded DNA-binding protein, partial [Ardenticatenaceae bacterium]